MFVMKRFAFEADFASLDLLKVGFDIFSGSDDHRMGQSRKFPMLKFQKNEKGTEIYW